MAIGENIRKLRKEKGLTQKQLGLRCGIDEANIRKYELGNAKPKLETIQKIADALKVDWRIFITEDYVEKREKEIDVLLSQSEAIKIVGESFDDPYAENMLLAYSLLNEKGKSEAFNRVEELTEIPRYTKPDEPPSK